MSGLSFQMQAASVVRALDDFTSEARDWTEVWRAFAPTVAAKFARAFSSQRGPLGEVWPELAPDSLRRKERMGRGRSMLMQSGRLFQEVSSPSTAVQLLTPRALRMGPSAEIAKRSAAQNYGVPARGVPARPFMEWTPAEALLLEQLGEARMLALAAKFEQKAALNGGT